MSGWHIAQINMGRLRAPVNDPLIDDFRAALPKINALAEAQPGFIWRLAGLGDDAPGIQPDEAAPRLALNITVWDSIERLAAFAYRTEHRDFVRRRLEWFEEPDGATLALWWVPAGHRPNLVECLGRLFHLRVHGPTPHAFDFKHRFEPAAAEEAA